MDYFFSKCDLGTFNDIDLDILVKHYNIQSQHKSDLLWLLAITIISGSQRATMPKNEDLYNFTTLTDEDLENFTIEEIIEIAMEISNKLFNDPLTEELASLEKQAKIAPSGVNIKRAYFKALKEILLERELAQCKNIDDPITGIVLQESTVTLTDNKCYDLNTLLKFIIERHYYDDLSDGDLQILLQLPGRFGDQVREYHKMRNSIKTNIADYLTRDDMLKLKNYILMAMGDGEQFSKDIAQIKKAHPDMMTHTIAQSVKSRGILNIYDFFKDRQEAASIFDYLYNIDDEKKFVYLTKYGEPTSKTNYMMTWLKMCINGEFCMKDLSKDLSRAFDRIATVFSISK